MQQSHAIPFWQDRTMIHDEHVNINAGSTAKAEAEATVVRGKQSWDFIYIALGFALAIEGTVIQMITPLAFPWNILLYALAASVTVWVLIFNGRFQNRLMAMKQAYENQAR
jgi:hypothetical protein